jgi:hypothetical protein
MEDNPSEYSEPQESLRECHGTPLVTAISTTTLSILKRMGPFHSLFLTIDGWVTTMDKRIIA